MGLVFIDPHDMERFPDERPSFDPDRDWIEIVGPECFRPSNDEEIAQGKPCRTCGRLKGERLYRKGAIVDASGYLVARPRVGLIVCLDCCKASLDHDPKYPGEVGDVQRPEYLVEQPKKVAPDDGLAGGKGKRKKKGVKA